MTKAEVREAYGNPNPKVFAHQVVQLNVVFEDDDGDTEVMFAVPVSYAKKVWDIQEDERFWDFVENEYTSDDSQLVLDNGINDRVVQYTDID